MIGWHLIDSAPRDGTEIEIGFYDKDADAMLDVVRMRWNAFAGNPIAQAGKGIWAMHHPETNELLMTWSEENPDAGPTHWRMPA